MVGSGVGLGLFGPTSFPWVRADPIRRVDRGNLAMIGWSPMDVDLTSQASKAAKTMDESHLPKRGPKSVTQRYSRDLSLAAREGIPADVMMDWIAALMEEGPYPALKRDARVEGGWTVVRPESGLMTTPEQRQWAWQQWRLAGYGQPAQSIHLEADLRARVASAHVAAPIGALTPAQMHAMRALLTGAAGALPAGTPALALTDPTESAETP